MIILTTLNLVSLLLSIGFVLISVLIEDTWFDDKLFSPTSYRIMVFGLFLMNIFIILHDSHLTVFLQ